ncbi:MAG: RrF2 family transcriptional regulator [Phycisphaerae bacterium]
MRLSKASAYAVFATIYIAEHEHAGPVHGGAIAETCGIPPEYLRKILQQLVRSRVLDSETGRGGGFTLRRPPGQTTLLEIVEAIDGPLDGELTVRKEISGADAAKAKLESVCAEAAQATKSLLHNATIEHLIASD